MYLQIRLVSLNQCFLWHVVFVWMNISVVKSHSWIPCNANHFHWIHLSSPFEIFYRYFCTSNILIECFIASFQQFQVHSHLLSSFKLYHCWLMSDIWLCVLVVKSFSLHLDVFICWNECLSLMLPCDRHFTSSRQFFHMYCSSNNFHSIHLFLPF